MEIKEEKSLETEMDGSNSPIQSTIKGLEDSTGEKEEKISEASREKREIFRDLEVSEERIEELESDTKNKSEFLLKIMESIRPLKDSLSESVERLKTIDDGGKIRMENDGDEDDITEMELNEETITILKEIKKARKLGELVESKIKEYTEAKRKEKKEFENSLVSLTEENHDINSLLRIALAEKDAFEKKMKTNNEQKRSPVLMQIAERGLQRVGFRFMVGSGSQEMVMEGPETGSSKSDGGTDTEEEIVSLASTVEKMMKNLRQEIAQLRRALEETRSDNERLQSVAEEQAQEIKHNRLHIKELEVRERALAKNIDQLLIEIKETGAEAARWREACELEVEAGKHEIAERDTLINIFKLEMERTKAALKMSNSKLKLKEDLVKMAMVAHEAAERSLKLADSRAAGLRNRIEELTKQLEEAETRERNRRKARRICWPWQALKAAKHVNSSGVQSTAGLLLRDTQALLRHRT